jgi:hypothetical protein
MSSTPPMEPREFYGRIAVAMEYMASIDPDDSRWILAANEAHQRLQEIRGQAEPWCWYGGPSRKRRGSRYEAKDS